MPELSVSFLPSDEILTFDFGDELLLFDPAAQSFILLNSTSSLIWQGLTSGLMLDTIVDSLSEATGMDRCQIAREVKVIITQWKGLGLDSRSSSVSICTSDDPLEIPPAPHSNIANAARKNMAVPFVCAFSMVSTSFLLYLPDEQLYHMVMNHIPQFLTEPLEQPDIVFSVVRDQNRFVLMKNNTSVDQSNGIETVIPMLHGAMMMEAYKRSNCMIGLHSAVVSYKECTLLMPAPAGSGKSTLTAALVGSGFLYGADDLVLLDETPGIIRPVPTSIGIKTGSWDIIENIYPGIVYKSIHLRDDNQKIRYLPIPQEKLIDPRGNKPLRVDLVVFPSFDSNSATRIEKVSPAQSMVSLSKAGFEIHKRLTPDNAVALVNWIKTIPFFSLTFSNLEEGILEIIHLTGHY